MPSWQMRELDGLGFWWEQRGGNIDGERTWEEHCDDYEHFKRVRQREPRVDEVMMTGRGDFAVGKWLTRQRREFRGGRMESCRIKRMEEAGVMWDGRWRGG